MLTTEDKVYICGIDISKFFCDERNQFAKNKFHDSVIDKHIKKIPELKDYEDYLWRYGHILLSEKEKVNKKEQYKYGIELLKNAKFIITDNSIRIRAMSMGKKNESVFFNERRYVDALLAEINKELKDLGFDKIDLDQFEVFAALENKKNKEWVDRFSLSLRNSFPNSSKLDLSIKLQIAYMQEFARTYSVTDDGFIEKKISDLESKINDLGESYSIQIILHTSIHTLSFLLRIDNYIEEYAKERKSIDDVTFTNKACHFTYDFLSFFSIYSKSINDDNMTQPHNIIRSLYKNFPQKGYREYEQIKRLKSFIEIAVMNNSRTGIIFM